MSDLTIATIAFNKPWAISEQIRLFSKYVSDDHKILVFDNSSESGAASMIERICAIEGVKYTRIITGKHFHHEALNMAAIILTEHESSPYIGFVDHDVFPATDVSLTEQIAHAGFLTVGQRHNPTGKVYAWPGFFFMSRSWLAGRNLNFNGIKGHMRADDGDTGSMNHHLFTEDTIREMYPLTHGYENIREHDDYGIQSFGIERIGDFIHLTNTSGWMDVPDAEGRERLLRERVREL